MEEIVESLQKRVLELEKKLEKYYQMLKITNELDFVVTGNYVTEEEIEDLAEGNYGGEDE